MDTLTTVYRELGSKLDQACAPLGDNLMETFGVNHKFTLPYPEIKRSAIAFQDSLTGYDWNHRFDMEKLHYNKLRYTLTHAFAENWFYKSEWIEETRRVVATSTDCISTISLYVRDGEMMISVYFRSSHYDNLLPVDLSFIAGLPLLFMEDLEHVHRTFEIDREMPVINTVSIDLSFGNLHRSVDNTQTTSEG